MPPSSQRVAILGAGSIALASAALLASRSHVPVLWSPRNTRAGGVLEATGALSQSVPLEIATTCEATVTGADAVLVAVPGPAYRTVLDALAPVLRPGQTVMISGHLSFAALYLSKLLFARGQHNPITAWGTTVVSSRRTGPLSVIVSSVRAEVEIATVPATNALEAATLCRTLFGDRFRERPGLLAIALSNVNPQNHLAIALCNFTRMERNETWFQNTNITAGVGRFMEALDAERLAAAAAFNVPVRTLREHFHRSFHTPEAPLGEMARALAENGSNPAAPTTTETRYVLEDAPFGLHPTALLARLAGQPAPLHEAGLAILSALYGRDLAADNDILPALGFPSVTGPDLRYYCESGWLQ